MEKANPMRDNAGILLQVLGCLTILGLCAVSQAANDRLAETGQAWERAVEAKGGRGQLHSIRSILRTETTTWDYRSLRPIKCFHTELFVLPFRMWSWDDERPTKKFALASRTVNLETDFAQMTYHIEGKAESPNPVGKPNVGDKRRIRQYQLFTFLETAWIRPKVLRSWRARDWLMPTVVVETEVEGEVYEWHFDSRSFLPRRVIARIPTTYGINEEEFRLEDYRLVDGLQLPHRITHGRFRRQIEYKLNVDYDEGIFHRAPSPSAGRDAWKRNNVPALKARE